MRGMLLAALLASAAAYPDSQLHGVLAPRPFKSVTVNFASKPTGSSFKAEAAVTGSTAECDACKGLECPGGWDTAISLEKGCSCICVPANTPAVGTSGGDGPRDAASSANGTATSSGADASSAASGGGSGGDGGSGGGGVGVSDGVDTSGAGSGRNSGGADAAAAGSSNSNTSGASSSGNVGAPKEEAKPGDDGKILVDPGWEQNANNCTFAAHLHIRKCGGTSVRKLFEGLAAYGWKQNLGYCASMDEHVNAVEENPSGKNWIEVHCAENIVLFNRGVERLRKKVEPKGCKVVSSLLVRNAADQAVSEWLYFYKDQQHIDRKEWATDIMDFAMSHPDEMLRLLTMNHRATAETSALWSGGDDKSLPALSSCDAAVELMQREAAKIDLVGSMDMPEDFTSFWAELGRMAGFPVYDGSKLAFNQHVKDHNPDGRASPDPEVTDEQMKQIAAVNGCSQRITDVVGRHLSQKLLARAAMAFDSSLGETTAQRLLRLWGRNEIAATVGHEAEPNSAEVLAAERAERESLSR